MSEVLFEENVAAAHRRSVLGLDDERAGQAVCVVARRVVVPEVGSFGRSSAAQVSQCTSTHSSNQQHV